MGTHIGPADMRHMLMLMRDAGYRRKTGQIVITGHHVVNEYLEACKTLSTFKHVHLFMTNRYMTKHSPTTIHDWKLIEEPSLQRITKEARPEGILALIPRPATNIQQVGNGGGGGGGTRQLWLWGGLRDPKNLGALARTALALGWSRLIITGSAAEPVDPFHPSAISASKGAILHLPISTIPPACSPSTTFFVASPEPDAIDITHLAPHTNRAGEIVLVLGSESGGLSGFPPPPLPATQIRKVSIATGQRMPFLNVAAAGAILMHSLDQLF